MEYRIEKDTMGEVKVPADKIGELTETKPLIYSTPLIVNKSTVVSDIITIDRFGNIISNFSKSEFEKLQNRKISAVKIKNKIISKFGMTYSSVNKGELLSLWGSSGFLEIAQNRGNAAKSIGCIRGKDKIEINFL